MKTFKSMSSAAGFAAASLLIAGAAKPALADVWHASAGAQSSDKSTQALAFLSNEHWIHAGDSILWDFPAAEIHTVTFLKPNQVRTPFPVGCPGTTPSGLSFTGAACVNSGTLANGATYEVSFPTPGNFKLVCLVHSRMTGSVHVLSLSEMLPHNQAFYDRQAHQQKFELLSSAIAMEVQESSDDQEFRRVTAGRSAISSTAGGSQAAALMRFLQETIVVHVGDTVQWTNPGLMVVHTITFGTEPADPIPPSPNVSVDPDGARHAFIGSPNTSVNSGFLSQQNQETIGFPQWPLDVTRFRVTFTAPGTFNYICAIHDALGMVGKVTVIP